MHIAFDAKRAFQNQTGLGNYSRSLIKNLVQHYPEHQYSLLAPKATALFDVQGHSTIQTVTPQGYWSQRFPSWWRRWGMVKDIAKLQADIFHGLSNELPAGLHKKGIRSVVTVHDLVFERLPGTYPFDQRYVHRWKIKQACRQADAVIAISKQTCEDLVHFYKVPPGKIHTCYQSCNPVFEEPVTAAKKKEIREKYNLPASFFLFVSSVTKRKNLITLCRAMALLKEETNMPLLVIGDGKKEKQEARQYMLQQGIADRLIFLNESAAAKTISFQQATDFPAIYQQAAALIYPSLFEGFGLPPLEAMWSGVPVISGNTSSLPEVGGEAVLYFDPLDEKMLATQMRKLISDNALADDLRRKGFGQARLFSAKRAADSVMNVYRYLLQ
jgi:glycosyltransferase involved in cell wall biosynthesis